MGYAAIAATTKRTHLTAVMARTDYPSKVLFGQSSWTEGAIRCGREGLGLNGVTCDSLVCQDVIALALRTTLP